MNAKASLTALPLPEAIRQVSTWLEDCEDLLGRTPTRDFPRPTFRLDEAWVVVRLAADQLAVATRGEIPHQLVGIAQLLEIERGPDFPARRAVLLEAARQLSVALALTDEHRAALRIRIGKIVSPWAWSPLGIIEHPERSQFARDEALAQSDEILGLLYAIQAAQVSA